MAAMKALIFTDEGERDMRRVGVGWYSRPAPPFVLACLGARPAASAMALHRKGAAPVWA
jgi:hypothetical protein